MARKTKDKMKDALKGRLEAPATTEEDKNTEKVEDEIIDALKEAKEKMERKEDMEKRFKLTVRVPKNVVEKLQVARIREGTTMTDLITNILTQWVEEHPEKWQINWEEI